MTWLWPQPRLQAHSRPWTARRQAGGRCLVGQARSALVPLQPRTRHQTWLHDCPAHMHHVHSPGPSAWSHWHLTAKDLEQDRPWRRCPAPHKTPPPQLQLPRCCFSHNCPRAKTSRQAGNALGEDVLRPPPALAAAALVLLQPRLPVPVVDLAGLLLGQGLIRCAAQASPAEGALLHLWSLALCAVQ